MTTGPGQNILAAIGLVISTVICAAAFIATSSRGTHASFYYLVLMYGVLLPISLVYLRSNHASSSRPAWSLAPVQVPVVFIALIAILFVSWSAANGRIISDESAYRFQARTYASGRIAAPPMPGASADARSRPPEIFFEHTIQAPWGWFSKFPPGWPLVLTLGYWLHIPWLINPLLAMVQLGCGWHLARPFGRTCQILAVTFIASSVYFLMWSVGFMAHACEATLALLALTCVLKSVHNGSVGWLATGFALVFVTTQVRPFTGAVIAAVCASIALFAFRTRTRLLIGAAGVIALTAVLSGCGFLLHNWIYTGDPFLSPYAALHGGRDVEEITLQAARILKNLVGITRWELTDTVRSMFPFLLLLAAYAVWRERQYRFEVISLSLLFPALILAHTIKTEPSGVYNGNRFYYEGFAAIAIAGARGCQLLIEHWRITRPQLLTGLAAMLVLQALQCAWGMKAVMRADEPYVAMYDYAHRELHTPLVFVHDSSPVFTAKHTNWNDVQWPSSPTIYLMDPGPERRDQVACRFGRPLWSVISFDPETRRISSTNGRAVCVGQTGSPVPRQGQS